MTNQDIVKGNRFAYMNGVMSFHEYYLWLGSFIGVTKDMIPFSLDQLKNSKDEHYNDLKIGMWDKQDYRVRYLANKKQIAWSLSDTVCVLKTLARQLLEE